MGIHNLREVIVLTRAKKKNGIDSNDDICQYIVMICPYCGSEEQLVINKRSTDKNLKNWRRRRCAKCFKVFTTYESTNLDFIKIVKKNGKRVAYKREKLYAGIYSAFSKIKNSDSGDSAALAEKIVNDIEYSLLQENTKDINTVDLRFLTYMTIQKYSFNAALNYFSYFYKPKNFGELSRIQKQITKGN